MATASITLKPMIQNTQLTGPQNQASSSLLSVGAADSGFNNWMEKAQSPAANSNRLGDRDLPSKGSELPNRDDRKETSSAQNDNKYADSLEEKRSSEASDSKPDRSNDKNQKADAAEQSDQSEPKKTEETSSSDSDSQNQAVAGKDQESSDQAAQAQTESETGSPQTADKTTTPTDKPVISTGTAALPEDADGEAELKGADPAIAKATGPLAADPDSVELDARAMSELKKAEAAGLVRQTGVGPDGLPPGVARASPRGQEQGAAFNRAGDASAQASLTAPSEGAPLPGTEALPNGDPAIAQPAATQAAEQNSNANTSPPVDTGSANTAGLASAESIDTIPVETVTTAEDVSTDTEVFTLSTSASQSERTTQSAPVSDPDLVQSTAETAMPAAPVNSLNPQSSAVEAKASPTPAPVNSAPQPTAPTQTSADPAQVARNQPIATTPAGSSDTGDLNQQQSQSKFGLAGEATINDNRPTNQAAASSSFAAEMNRLSSSPIDPVYQRAFERMQQPNWGQQLGQRAIMMAQQGPKTALVQLDPPELGALQVRVHIQDGDKVSVSFTAPSAGTREALEQHLPRLREMFAEQGLNLAQSDVRDQSASNSGQDQPGSSKGQGSQYGQGAEVGPVLEEMSVPVGVVDLHV